MRVARPILWMTVCCLVLGGSYGLVRILLNGDATLQAVPHGFEETRQLMAYFEELSSLLREFEGRPPPHSTAEIAALRRWTEYSYAPRVNDLRQRLILADSQGQAYQALLAASDRLAALAASPQSARMRDAVRRSLEEADRFLTIQQEGTGRR